MDVIKYMPYMSPAELKALQGLMDVIKYMSPAELKGYIHYIVQTVRVCAWRIAGSNPCAASFQSIFIPHIIPLKLINCLW